jgi:hypothetical protein
VEKAGERVSTLDLFERGWVLLTENERWNAACAKAADELGVDVTPVRIGVDIRPSDVEGFRKAFGIGPTGASLIRPDGFIAWRAVELGEDPAVALTDALGRVSSATRRPHGGGGERGA